jgi:quercetin dioxygenase-like cupin family protein
MGESDGGLGRSPDALDTLDAMTAAPDHHEVLLENEKVRVLDTRLGPGESTPVHTHCWPAVLYVLGWSDFIRHDAEGNPILDSRDQGMKPANGSTLWSGPLQPHFVKNIGDCDLHIIAVELKDS